MGLLIFFFTVSITVSFLCSLFEAALLSTSPSYVEVKAQEKSWVGLRLQEMKSNVDIPLSAILTLNTIAHTAGAIGVGVQATKVFGEHSISLLGLETNIEGVIAALMTLAILVLSELLPKSIGAAYWKKLTGFTVHSLHFLIIVLYPFVWMSKFITTLIKKEENGSVLSRTEISAMADMGAKEGIIEESEHTIIKNLMKFRKIQAYDIMTPRTVVKAAHEDMTIQEFYDQNPDLRFSRIPVYTENVDQVTGFILKDQLLSKIINKEGHEPLKSIARSLPGVTEEIPVPDLFEQMMSNQQQIVMVHDEYGGMAGIVTMEDIMETLLGLEIVDEMDDTEDMQVLARKNWEMRAKRLGLIQKNSDSNSASEDAAADEDQPVEN